MTSVVFLRDGRSRVHPGSLLYEPRHGACLAPQVDAARAKAIEEDFSRRIAAAPDRFRDQIPLPGSREAILRGIDDLQRGAPNYERMSAALAAKIRRQASRAAGHVQGVRRGGIDLLPRRRPGVGYDIYGVKFVNGVAEFRILLGAGRQGRRCHLPAGWQQQARRKSLACLLGRGRASGATRRRPRRSRCWIYNGSGSDLQLFKLDAEGKRAAFGTIGEEMAFPVTTYVDSLWVMRRSSRGAVWRSCCRDSKRAFIPSRRTAGPGGAVLQRTVPLAGSEANAARIYRGHWPRRAGLRSR